MNKFYLSVVCTLVINFAFSAPINKSIATGNWNQTSTWSLNRLPQSGDTVVITPGNIVTISDDETLNAASFLQVYGKLYFQNNNSTLSLANNSIVWVFAGGMIQGGSASQKLRLNAAIIFSGNQDPVYGPEMATSISNGFTAFSGFTSVVLPVKFIAFTVSLKNSNAFIQWSTAEEIGTNRFEIERSVDGSNWNLIATVTAKGNSSKQTDYTYIDNSLNSKQVYYRVKEVDVKGTAMYTPVSGIKTDANQTSEVKFASIQNRVMLQFPTQINGNVTVRLVSMGGQVLDQQTISNPAGQIVMNTKFSGNYIISVSNGQFSTAKQIIL